MPGGLTKKIRRGFGFRIAAGDRRGKFFLETDHLISGGLRLLFCELFLPLDRQECFGGFLIVLSLESFIRGG